MFKTSPGSIVVSIIFLLGISFGPLAHAGGSKEAISKPRKSDGQEQKVNCDDWEKDDGREGACLVKSSGTEWKQNYLLLGSPKLAWKGEVKNLVVLFPPDGYDHKIDSWWAFLVGPNKAIDTNAHVVLVMDRIGTKPETLGSTILVTGSEIVKVQKMVLDHLFPSLKPLVVGGPSRGGDNAVLFSATYPKLANKLIIFQSHLAPGWQEGEPTKEVMENFPLKEMELGPYEYWDQADKKKWWDAYHVAYAEVLYTPAYFKNIALVNEEHFPDAPLAQGLEVGAIKEKIIQNWTAWAVQTFSPQWEIAAVNAWNNTDFNLKLFSKLPKHIFVAANTQDQLIPIGEVNTFVDILRNAGKNVELHRFESIRGHQSCCVPTQSFPEISTQLGSFLN